MPQIGDLFAKLGQGQTLSVGEIETLRLEMNRLQQNAGRLDAISAPTGGLDPNVFRNSAPFSVLPHPCAALHRSTGTASGNLSLANNSWTTVTFDPESSANTATWNFGLNIDPTLGRIYVTGLDRHTVLLVVMWASFDNNATGKRAIAWFSDTGDVRYEYEPSNGAGDNTFVQLVHMRRIKSDYTYFYMQALQDSGGILNLEAMYMSIAVIR